MEFTVETQHPADRWNGTHTFYVKAQNDPSGRPAFYAHAEHFGCSRHVSSVHKAIRVLAEASGATVLKITEAAR